MNSIWICRVCEELYEDETTYCEVCDRETNLEEVSRADLGMEE